METKLNLYQFNLPTNTNAGLSYEKARNDWAAKALELAGGYTLLPGFALGFWKAPGSPRIYKDTIAVYQVACVSRVAGLLLAEFWKLFPDQEAAFMADLGPASIIDRPAQADAA